MRRNFPTVVPARGRISLLCAVVILSLIGGFRERQHTSELTHAEQGVGLNGLPCPFQIYNYILCCCCKQHSSVIAFLWASQNWHLYGFNLILTENRDSAGIHPDLEISLLACLPALPSPPQPTCRNTKGLASWYLKYRELVLNSLHVHLLNSCLCLQIENSI